MEATLIFLVPQIIYSGKFSEREAESIVLEGRDKATDWLENNIDYSSRVRAHAENARLRDEVIKLEMQIASMNVEGAAAAQGSDRRGGGGAGEVARLSNLYYKRTMCKYWEAGYCKGEQQCTFAHGHHEIERFAPARYSGHGYRREQEQEGE
jgi:hypothetical protein